MLGCVAGGKLRVIADQIRALQQRAREILDETKQANDLHRVECGFRKRAGHVYYLYCRADESPYFSMLSPEDWRGTPPDVYVGAYRLEADMLFTKLDTQGTQGENEGEERCGRQTRLLDVSMKRD
jgi:hypothetical protein